MAYITQKEYYDSASNHGSYQYVSLEDIVKNFMLMYSGNHSLVNNEERYKALFHAKRGIQELNYDAFKNVKVLQLDCTDTLTFVLPYDYVNWVRISAYIDGFILPLSENIQVMSTVSYAQDASGTVLFDAEGVVQTIDSEVNLDILSNVKKSIYLNGSSPLSGSMGYNYNGDWYFDFSIGARYGLNTETANKNPTFTIDKNRGVISFNSDMSGRSVILEYVSDGMENGDDSSVSVNKMFEEYIYAYINYSILDSKLGVQEYIVNRARKKKTALLRNARIRISNIKPGRLLMNLRGQDKIIK
jgi:hypothetical protein